MDPNEWQAAFSEALSPLSKYLLVTRSTEEWKHMHF